MSSISSIGSASYGISLNIGTTEQLSAATKAKLEALGIDPSTVTSEAQAQALIRQAEAVQHQNSAGDNKNSDNQKDKERAQQFYNAMDMVSVSNKLLLGLN